MTTPDPMTWAKNRLQQAGWPPNTTPRPPKARSEQGAPIPTVDDPTAGGYYCGARRKVSRLAIDWENDAAPWPWCSSTAGWGTPQRTGPCKFHFGATENARRAAVLKLAELAPAAIATLARALTQSDVPWHVRQRAASDILDRSGYPKRSEVDVEAQRDGLAERIARAVSDVENLDDVDDD